LLKRQKGQKALIVMVPKASQAHSWRDGLINDGNFPACSLVGRAGMTYFLPHECGTLE
jgi:hypothetical protein